MLSRVAFLEQLQELGLRPGMTVMVHAGLRELGPVEGRAAGIISAILEALGPEGTMVMVLGADPDEPFDALHTEVDIEDFGVLAETFRTYPGTRVSDHAASRYAAHGPKAAALIDDPPLHHYHGPNSTLQRLVNDGASILRFGADEDTITLTHYAEYLAEIDGKRSVRVRYERADTGEQWLDSLDDNWGVKHWEGGDYFEQIYFDYLDAARARVGPLGACQAELIDAGDFLAFAKAWMELNL